MPLAARRLRRAAVIGPAPVARTAATVATVAVVAQRGQPADGPPGRPPRPPPLRNTRPLISTTPEECHDRVRPEHQTVPTAIRPRSRATAG